MDYYDFIYTFMFVIPFHNDNFLDGALLCPILMWCSAWLNLIFLLLLQQLLHKLWWIEDPIISVVYLDHHSLTLSLPLKNKFYLPSFSSIYSYLVLDAHITKGVWYKTHPSENISDGCGHTLCGGAYLYPLRYSDLKTPYVQAEEDTYWALASS